MDSPTLDISTGLAPPAEASVGATAEPSVVGMAPNLPAMPEPNPPGIVIDTPGIGVDNGPAAATGDKHFRVCHFLCCIT